MIDLMFDTPRACASRLARYMSDPSKIRVYVLDTFGRAPAVDDIRGMIEGWKQSRIEDRTDRRWKPQDSDALHWQPNSLVGTRTVHLEPVEGTPIKAAEKLARMVPRARVGPKAKAIGPAARVIDRASVLFAIPVPELLGKSRKYRTHVLPRHCCAYTIRTCSDGKVSFPEIGRMLGGRDHSTVIHGYHQIKDSLPSDEGLADIIAELSEAWGPPSKIYFAEMAETGIAE